jgi:hypothetical protein
MFGSVHFVHSWYEHSRQLLPNKVEQLVHGFVLIGTFVSLLDKQVDDGVH